MSTFCSQNVSVEENVIPFECTPRIVAEVKNKSWTLEMSLNIGALYIFVVSHLKLQSHIKLSPRDGEASAESLRWDAGAKFFNKSDAYCSSQSGSRQSGGGWCLHEIAWRLGGCSRISGWQQPATRSPWLMFPQLLKIAHYWHILSAKKNMCSAKNKTTSIHNDIIYSNHNVTNSNRSNMFILVSDANIPWVVHIWFMWAKTKEKGEGKPLSRNVDVQPWHPNALCKKTPNVKKSSDWGYIWTFS